MHVQLASLPGLPTVQFLTMKRPGSAAIVTVGNSNTMFPISVIGLGTSSIVPWWLYILQAEVFDKISLVF